MLTINCQSSIKIIGEKTIYFDPLKVKEKHDADLIFITHTHWDHFSKEDILKVKNKQTKIIGPCDIKEPCLELGFSEQQLITILPKEKKIIDGIEFQTVPAYNKEKEYHPKENNWLGYVIEIDKIRYYIMGDTDALEENQKIDCDVLCIPIGGTYTMNARQAAEFTNKLNPKKAIPIHYGMVVGTKEDLELYESLIEVPLEEKIIF